MHLFYTHITPYLNTTLIHNYNIHAPILYSHATVFPLEWKQEQRKPAKPGRCGGAHPESLYWDTGDRV